jgi:glyoxylase-like metal-dependent hydrolase (beta-lactamase superfamily II)
MGIRTQLFPMGPLEENTYLVTDEDTGYKAVIDPGYLGCDVKLAIGDADNLRLILLTHGHFDHVLGVAELASRYDNLPVYMHPADKATLAGNEYFSKWFGAPLPASFETVDICEACPSEGCANGPSDSHAGNPSEDCTDAPSASCTDGSSEGCTDGPDGQKCISVIEVGGLRFNVIETPGHTPGGVSFYEPAEKVLFSGDSLFAGAIGRTDHPGGDYEMLMKSILGKLVTLEGSVSVIPGHGPCTDIAREGMTNPFLLPFNEPVED